MKQLKSFALAILLGTGVIGVASHPAKAVTLVVNADGQLTGATGVDLGSLGLFDVEFLDGTCSALFDGCDNAADDFIFTDAFSASTAATALLAQVFRDTIQGNFDTEPQGTFGCGDTSECISLIPFESIAPGVLRAATATNFMLPGNALGTVTAFTTDDTSPFDIITYARFSRIAANAVPEPASVLLFGVGLAGLARIRRRRQWGLFRLGVE